jgi:hypothetical protein
MPEIASWTALNGLNRRHNYRQMKPSSAIESRGNRPLMLALCLWATCAAACGGGVPSDSACRKLAYDAKGPSRAEYLPCAGEMVAVLNELDAQVQAAVKGDQPARTQGRASVGRLRALMNAAGGRTLLDRWSDQALTDFNLDVNNAITHYEAFYTIRILDEPSPYAAQSREAAEQEARAAAKRYQEARSLYRRLR